MHFIFTWNLYYSHIHFCETCTSEVEKKHQDFVYDPQCVKLWVLNRLTSNFVFGDNNPSESCGPLREKYRIVCYSFEGQNLLRSLKMLRIGHLIWESFLIKVGCNKTRRLDLNWLHKEIGGQIKWERVLCEPKAFVGVPSLNSGGKRRELTKMSSVIQV